MWDDGVWCSAALRRTGLKSGFIKQIEPMALYVVKAISYLNSKQVCPVTEKDKHSIAAKGSASLDIIATDFNSLAIGPAHIKPAAGI